MSEDNSASNKLPKSYWVSTIFFFLWNVMGVLSFIAHIFISQEEIAKLPEMEQELYGQYPLWIVIIFAIAVFSGLTGSIGLFLRKQWAKIAFIISLSAIIIQMIHNVFFTKSIEVYGVAQAITMPILVVVIGVTLVWFSKYSINKKWLN